MISVRDTEQFAETYHLQCLSPFFNVCCYGPRLICIQKYGHGQGTHQSDLGAYGDALVVPGDFKFKTLRKKRGVDWQEANHGWAKQNNQSSVCAVSQSSSK